MTANKLRPGAQHLMGNDIDTTAEAQAFFYPDPLSGGTAPANSFGLAKAIGDSVFNHPAGTRSAIVYSFWCGLASAAGASFQIKSHDGTVLYLEIAAATFVPTQVNFGEEGILLEDGFRVDVVGSPAALADFMISYEVV